MESLLANGMLQLMQYNSNKYADVNLFEFHFVYEIKRKATDKPYKKSRLIIQGYNDIKKMALLTQVLIIQQCSQRLLFSISLTLKK